MSVKYHAGVLRWLLVVILDLGGGAGEAFFSISNQGDGKPGVVLWLFSSINSSIIRQGTSPALTNKVRGIIMAWKSIIPQEFHERNIYGSIPECWLMSNITEICTCTRFELPHCYMQITNKQIKRPFLKASRMGHSVKASLWCDSLLINNRFRFPYFRMSNC